MRCRFCRRKGRYICVFNCDNCDIDDYNVCFVAKLEFLGLEDDHVYVYVYVVYR